MGRSRDPAEDEARRRRATLGVDRLLSAVLGPTARRRGFAEAAILSDWAAIVGPTLAGRCQPIRVDFPRGRYRGGTLELQARGGAALEIQHLAPQLVERVNGFFGYPAIRRLRLVQAPPAPRLAPLAARPRQQLSEADEQALCARVGALADRPLGRALLDLGRAMHSNRRS